MAHVTRDDRRFIAPEKFREAMRNVFGERPNFRTVARQISVPRSTLHRLWHGASCVSSENMSRLAATFGVHPDWLTYPLHNPPKLDGGGDTLIAVGHVLPGTPRGEVRTTTPTVKGLYWLARGLAAIERTLGHAKSDLWMRNSPLACHLGRIEPGPMVKAIDDVFRVLTRNGAWRWVDYRFGSGEMSWTRCTERGESLLRLPRELNLGVERTAASSGVKRAERTR